MRNLFNGTCDQCEERDGKAKAFKPRCAVVAVRGCNAYGDRDTRVQTLCEECRRRIKGLYRLHPQHTKEPSHGR